MYGGTDSNNDLLLEVINLGDLSFFSLKYAFLNASQLTSFNAKHTDTSNVTDMYGMFHGANALTSLDLTKFNTENVTDMGIMFTGASNLLGLDLSSFDTSNVEDMN